jgi:excisionase family DNA binding protein
MPILMHGATLREVTSMRLLRVEEAATALGLKIPTVRRMIRRGQIPAVRPTGARAVRVRSEDIDAVIRLGSAVKQPKPVA